MLKKLLCLSLTMLVIISQVSCGTKNNEERKLCVNSSINADQFIWKIIQECELLEKYVPEGVTIEWSSITSGTELRDALISDRLDIASIAVLSLATAEQNGMPLVYINNAGGNLMGLYSGNDNIQEMNDLNGSYKISVSSIGTGPHTAFLLGVNDKLGASALAEFEDSMVTMANSDAVNAMISGTVGVDAAVITFPTSIMAENNKSIHLVQDLSGEVLDYGVFTVTCATSDFIEDNPDLVKAYLNAYTEAVDIMKNDTERAVEIMLKVYDGCTQEMAETFLENYVYTIETGMENYDTLMSFLYEQNILDKPAALFKDIPKYEDVK